MSASSKPSSSTAAINAMLSESALPARATTSTLEPPM
jgi:hypothetical protein